MPLIFRKILAFMLIAGMAFVLFAVAKSPTLIGNMELKLGNAPLEFSIREGQSAASVANELYQKQLIPHPLLLRLYWQVMGSAHQLQAGDYLLTPKMTIQQMLALFAKGALREYKFTIIEGWQFADLIKALKSQKNLRHTLPDLPRDQLYQHIMTELGAADVFAEGMFLPQTYYFSKKTRDMDILRRAHELLNSTLASAWDKRQVQDIYKDPYQALIMASIVEKETGKPEERPLIAGVFANRLRKGMRLQTDPTVIYGMGASYKGKIRYKDLRTDTAYNTYTRYGLPPTPIALAGEAAIHAALNPQSTKALYFVSQNDGTHVFSNTLQEHNRAVNQFQRNKAAQ